VDDGTAGTFGTDIKARAMLEDVLRDPKSFQEHRRVVIEALCLVNSLSSNPTAVVKGLKSWAAGDLIKFHQYLADMCKNADQPVGSDLETIVIEVLRDLLDLPDSAEDSNGGRFVPLKEKEIVRKYLMPNPDPQTSEGMQKPDVPDTSDKPRINLCFKCDGSYCVNLSLKRFCNSVSSKEYNNWHMVQAELQRVPASVNICNGCGVRLSSEDVSKEVFYPCKEASCDHYFFRSRVLDLRQKGRDKIICDKCHGRTKLDDILGKFVPGVLVVVQGGVGTIRTVAATNAMRIQEDDAEGGNDLESPEWDTLQQSKESCTPLVIVEGSGKAADFIASTWRHMHEGDRMCYGCPRSSCIALTRRFESSRTKQARLLASTCPVVSAEHCRIFGSIEESDREKQVSWVIEACRRKETVTLYDPSRSNEGLDFAIMRAICKGTLRDGRPLSMIEQFQLTIDWSLAAKEVSSSHDVSACARLILVTSIPILLILISLCYCQGTAALAVEREILADFASDATELSLELRKQALFYALKRNSWQSVQLLLNAGVSLPNRDSALKDLFPRDRDESSNDETAVLNSLNSCLLSERVKDLTIRRIFRNYRDGVLSDEILPASASGEARSNSFSLLCCSPLQA
jgi:hypothetical protein